MSYVCTLFISTQPTLSDVSFRVEGSLVHAHKLVLCLRCDVMSAMLTGGFKESQSNEVGNVTINGRELEMRLCTDQCPVRKQCLQSYILRVFNDIHM